MSLKNQMNADTLAWLLETDSPGVRFLALRDLLDRPNDDPELAEARKAAHTYGPIAVILSNMAEAGYWSAPGPGYNPKYWSTVWSVILLAQLGASIFEDERIARACIYIRDHTLTQGGQFTASGTPSGTADCLQGNLCWSLVALGYEDPCLETAFDWMARTVNGKGIAPVEEKHAEVRYYAGKCGPTFACGLNNKLPCAWGAVKVMQAFASWPGERRTCIIQDAIRHGVDFLFSVDPATASYPNGWAEKPSGNWWKFGFPVFYITDILQVVETLVGLGYGNDPRLENALALIHKKKNDQGRWLLEYNYTGKTWVDFGVKRQPNKWVTLRALRVMKAAAWT